MKKFLEWLPIWLVIIGMAVGAVCWATAEHQDVREDCRAQIQRSEDSFGTRLDRIESKIDWIISKMVE